VLKDLVERKEITNTTFHIPLSTPQPTDHPLKKKHLRGRLFKDGEPILAKFYDPRLLGLSTFTLLENGWKLIDPSSVEMERVDGDCIGEGWDWVVKKQDPEKVRISFRERKVWAERDMMRKREWESV
jgi:hypothetical protein